MTVRDLLQDAAGNLWRMKLRATLTIAGVLIAIAAFVSMLSFGAGMQKTIADNFEAMGLFTTMYVYPAGKGPRQGRRHNPERNKTGERGSSDTLETHDTLAESDTLESDSTAIVTNTEQEKHPLDSLAVERLAGIPGVKLAYPYENLAVNVRFRDTSFDTKARAVPVSALATKMFTHFKAGKAYGSDTAREILVTDRFLLKAGVKLDSVESVLGDSVIVSVSVVSLDSAISHALFDKNLDSVREHFSDLRFDSLADADYRSRLFSRELSGVFGRFVDGYMNSRAEVAETLTISGVIDAGLEEAVKPVVLPVGAGRRFSEAGFSGSQQDFLTSLASGKLPGFSGGGESATEYSRVTLNLDQGVPYQSIKDSVEALGYDTYSFAEEFSQIQNVFLFFNMALGMIGLIALVTASLGIVNTMVMSILERRREIGVLKSLGADDSDIRMMYLFESAFIGIVGAVGGIVVGWLITRGAALVAKFYMESKDIPPMDFFALPWWLIVISLGIGLFVSVVAGMYPASRAASVDPVQALRSE